MYKPIVLGLVVLASVCSVWGQENEGSKVDPAAPNKSKFRAKLPPKRQIRIRTLPAVSTPPNTPEPNQGRLDPGAGSNAGAGIQIPMPGK